MRFVLDLQHAVLNSELPAPARHLLLSLAVKADWETGVIPTEHTPALSTLVAMTGLSKSTIAEWLQALETGGWIQRDRPAKTSGTARTGYALLIGCPSIAKPDRASRRHRTTAAAGSPPGGLPDEDRHATDMSMFGGPPSGSVRLADTRSDPPGGTAAVRLADHDCPRGGHAPRENSPSESSTSKDRPGRDRGHRRTPAGSPGQPVLDTGVGSRLPDDFRATDEMITWAQKHTPDVGRSTTDAFIDYWKAQPGQRGRKTDWIATWRNWMRREQADIERRRGFRGTPVQTAIDAVMPPRPAAGEMCADHRGYRAATCGLCRAERIAVFI